MAAPHGSRGLPSLPGFLSLSPAKRSPLPPPPPPLPADRPPPLPPVPALDPSTNREERARFSSPAAAFPPDRDGGKRRSRFDLAPAAAFPPDRDDGKRRSRFDLAPAAAPAATAPCPPKGKDPIHSPPPPPPRPPIKFHLGSGSSSPLKKSKLSKRCFARPSTGTAAPSSPPPPRALASTIIVENLSPFTGELAVRSGLSQLGTVNRIELREDPLFPGSNKYMGWAAVEMATAEQATNAVDTASHYNFLLGGAPRPVMIRPATSGDGVFGSGAAAAGGGSPRIVHKDDYGAAGLAKLRDLQKQHLAQEALLERLQAEEAEALHEKQHQRVNEYLCIFDQLGNPGVQQKFANYRSRFCWAPPPPPWNFLLPPLLPPLPPP